MSAFGGRPADICSMRVLRILTRSGPLAGAGRSSISQEPAGTNLAAMTSYNAGSARDLVSNVRRAKLRPTIEIRRTPMSVDLKNEATDVEDASRGKTDLSRRSFLVSLAVVGIGSAIAMRLSVSGANAVPKTEIASGTKDLKNSETLPESKTAEVVEKVDPNDPLTHFNQPYYRHRRRVARRVYRRSRRVTRRVYRRGRRVVRRTYRRVRRGYYY
jgi:hypothetical protein